MHGSSYVTKADVLRRACEIIGLRLGDIDRTGRLATGKGAIGTVIEESWFGYSPNSDSEPDFPEAGVELKVTPYVKSRNGLRAKERLVCNIINYMEEYDKTFYTSSFWHKCNTMLLMSYEHRYDKLKEDYTIDKAILFSFPQNDLMIIENDWKTIIEKIRTGKAHEISEADTLYLAACTKGTDSSSVRPQPFSTKLAKQRAYSLKASYMTQILTGYIFGEKHDEQIIKDWHMLIEKSFEQNIIDQLKPYYGLTLHDLKYRFGLETDAKNIIELLLGKMLGISGRINTSEEFLKSGIVPKTVRLMSDGKAKESMSFPNFDFIELTKQTWEESDLYCLLSTTRFMFVVFQSEQTNDPHKMLHDLSISDVYHEQPAPDGITDFIFKGVVFWNMPNQDLDEVHRVWEKTVSTIKTGVTLIRTSRGISNNLPKQTESPIAHVRPHAKDSSDTLPLPDGRQMVKQCFWLNSEYISKQVRTLIEQ